MKLKLPGLFAAALWGAFATAPALAKEAPSSALCPLPAGWVTLDGDDRRPAPGAAVFEAMARRDVVLLGERHDDEDHHRWQLQALAALHAQRPDMVIGFEMFPRRVQPVLDRWVAGELTVAQFLAQTEWDKVWRFPAELYLPLFQFARINRIPMVALNVDQKLTRAVGEKGWDEVPESEREGVGRAAEPPEAYRDFLFDIYREHAVMRGKGAAEVKKDDAGFRNFIQSQTTWDRAMAEALARPLAGAGADKPLVVGIMGHGHVRFGYGVPHQLRALGVDKVGTLVPVNADADCSEARSGFADAVFALPPRPATKPEPPRLGIRLEEKDGAVRIAQVSAGSLAERTGLRSGDHLLEVAGVPATGSSPVLASIRRQPEGTWLPMRVKRGEETLELVVKFPAAQ